MMDIYIRPVLGGCGVPVLREKLFGVFVGVWVCIYDK